jgi:oligogalacturonide lyase
MRNLTALAMALTLTGLGGVAAQEPPTDWIDPATGHRVIRISRDPGSSSLYFHQNTYTPEGDRLLITTPQGTAAVDLTTLGQSTPPKIDVVMSGRNPLAVAWKAREVYHTKGGALFATNIDTKIAREVAKFPSDLKGGNLAVNADGALVVGLATDPQGKSVPRTLPNGANPAGRLEPRWAAGTPMVLYTVNTKTGETKRLLHGNDWFNHLQCSPTDPNLILFCHEGPWHFVDRVWTIRADGGPPRLMHARTMPNEIAGHEFFGHDGKWVWYDLQTPRSKEFWLAGVNAETGERIRYPVERGNWSVHFNQSHDGKRFAGDGGGPNSVANRTPLPDNKPLNPPGNGQWIFLFTPREGQFETIKVGNEEVKVGKFDVEKLVDLSKHDYGLEPNVTFTPDNKWVVFRSNMHGATHVYAVEVKKSR